MSIATIGRIVVLEENVEDIYKNVCRCPHCGDKTLYGDMMMVSGHHCCPKCVEHLRKEIEFDKEFKYDIYVKKDYEPFKFDVNNLKTNVLNVIRNKNVDIGLLKSAFDFKDYNRMVKNLYRVNKVEFSLLKQWLQEGWK